MGSIGRRDLLNHSIRTMGRVVFSGFLALSMGCLTPIVDDLTQPERHHKKIVSEDTIFAIGKPDQNLHNQIGTTSAFIFLGKKKSYVITTGAEDLVTISKKLNPRYLGIETWTPTLFLKDGQIFGSLKIFYQMEPFKKPIVGEEREQLDALGFKPHKIEPFRYELSIEVNGFVCPRIQISEDDLGKFKLERKIVFYSATNKSSLPRVTKSLTRTILMPVARAIDLVTFPAQVAIGVPVLMVTAATGAISIH